MLCFFIDIVYLRAKKKESIMGKIIATNNGKNVLILKAIIKENNKNRINIR